MTFVEPITIVGLPFYTRANSRGMAESVKILRAEGIEDRLRGSTKSFRGRGPELDGVVKSGKTILSDGNVAPIASRALDPLEFENMNSCPMKIISAPAIRKEGVTPAVNSAISSLVSRCDWIACHLDVDSLDPEFMPAVNFPEPGGLTVEEAKTIVSALIQTRKMKLFELAGYNASLDPSRACALKLVNTIAETLTGAFPPLGLRT